MGGWVGQKMAQKNRISFVDGPQPKCRADNVITVMESFSATTAPVSITRSTSKKSIRIIVYLRLLELDTKFFALPKGQNKPKMKIFQLAIFEKF